MGCKGSRVRIPPPRPVIPRVSTERSKPFFRFWLLRGPIRGATNGAGFSAWRESVLAGRRDLFGRRPALRGMQHAKNRDRFAIDAIHHYVVGMYHRLARTRNAARGLSRAMKSMMHSRSAIASGCQTSFIPWPGPVDTGRRDGRQSAHGPHRRVRVNSDLKSSPANISYRCWRQADLQCPRIKHLRVGCEILHVAGDDGKAVALCGGHQQRVHHRQRLAGKF